MHLAIAFLSDHAESIGGKLYVHGGLVTEIERAEYPAPLDLSLVLVLEHERTDSATDHHLEIRLMDADGHMLGDAFAADVGIGEIGDAVPHALPFRLPIVLRIAVAIPAEGLYQFAVSIGEDHVASVPFLAILATDDEAA